MNCSAENQPWLYETICGPYSFQQCLDTAMHDNMKLLILPSGNELFMFFFRGEHPPIVTLMLKCLVIYMKVNITLYLIYFRPVYHLAPGIIFKIASEWISIYSSIYFVCRTLSYIHWTNAFCNPLQNSIGTNRSPSAAVGKSLLSVTGK